jgi:NAD+ synthase (glutamine-hydrolysing)
MFERVRRIRKELTPEEVATKVKHFFRYYGMNRHKQTTITPSMHFMSSSCDDNRFDMRPFLYNCDWTFQFKEIDKRVKQLNEMGPV